MFELFRKKRTEPGLGDLLAEYAAYQAVSARIAKAQSLRKLGRLDEARREFDGAEITAKDYVRRYPTDKRAHVLLCLVYVESGANELAVAALKTLLTPGAFALDAKDRLIVEGQLQRLERERPSDKKTSGAPKSFTQVYACLNCGRLHNYASLPCPHCTEFAEDIGAMARAVVLSNSYLRIHSLLLVSREMQKGRKPEEIVTNLDSNAAEYLRRPETRKIASDLLAMLREAQGKPDRTFGHARQCPTCATRVLLSTADHCQECGAAIHWPAILRLMVCVDNLLWLFEQRVEVRASDEFAELVCLLVVIANNLLRKQQAPSDDFRKYAVKLLVSLGSVGDTNNGAVIDLSKLTDPQIYLVKDRMTKESETFGLLLLVEIKAFIQAMISSELEKQP
jgi:hypothetical protein